MHSSRLLVTAAVVFVAVAAFVPAGSTSNNRGASAKGGLPAPLTLHGVGGVRPGMGWAMMRRQWHLHFPVELKSSGSASRWTAPICAGDMVGQAVSGRGVTGLDAIWFVRGARTDAGIGIGSTLAALRHAYGRGLQAPRAFFPYEGDPDTKWLAESKSFKLVAEKPGTPKRPAIAMKFVVKNGRVVGVLFGSKQDIDLVPLAAYNVMC